MNYVNDFDAANRLSSHKVFDKGLFRVGGNIIKAMRPRRKVWLTRNNITNKIAGSTDSDFYETWTVVEQTNCPFWAI